MKKLIIASLAFLQSFAFAKDWQNENFLNTLISSDPNRKDEFKIGFTSIGQEAYVTARYGRENQYFQLTRAIEERMNCFTDSNVTNISFVTRRNILNMPVVPPGTKIDLNWWKTSGLNEFKDSDGTPVLYANNTGSGIYSFKTIVQSVQYHRWYGRKDYREIKPSDEILSLAEKCRGWRISFAAHPFGAYIVRKSEISEELSHMFNPHRRCEGEVGNRTANIIADQLIWGEFVASYAVLKADGFRRGYDFGIEGEFNRYWNDFNDNNTFSRIEGDLTKEAKLLLMALMQAKAAIAAGTATQRQINGVAWASNPIVGRIVL